MIDKELSEKISILGYTQTWLDSGVLTKDFLLDQFEAFSKSDNKNTEHYRYKTFILYLDSKETLSDTEFDNYIKLTLSDHDSAMAGSAIQQLFTKTSLTAAQFDRLCKEIISFGDWTEKIIVRQKLLRDIKEKNLTKELFDDCLLSRDNTIQEKILDLVDRNQAMELAVKGSTKSIRNLAREKLKKLGH